MSRQSLLTAATVRAPDRTQASLRHAVEHGAVIEVRDRDGVPVDSPELIKLLERALAGLASGDDVVLLTSESQLTPAEAGQVLGYSRQYVDRLIDLEELPAHLLPGSRHRRLRTADVLAFRDERLINRARIATAIEGLLDAGADY